MPELKINDEIKRLVDMQPADLIGELNKARARFHDYLQSLGVEVPKIVAREETSFDDESEHAVLLDSFTAETISSMSESALTVFSTTQALMNLYTLLPESDLLKLATVTIEGKEPCTVQELKDLLDSEAEGLSLESPLVIGSADLKALLPELLDAPTGPEEVATLDIGDLDNLFDEDEPEEQVEEALVPEAEPAEDQPVSTAEEVAEAAWPAEEQDETPLEELSPLIAQDEYDTLMSDANPTISFNEILSSTASTPASSAPLSTEGALSQDDMDALLGGSTEPPEQSANKSDLMSQDDLNELFAQNDALATPATAVDSSETAPDSLGQSELDALLGGLSSEENKEEESLDQSELDALFSPATPSLDTEEPNADDLPDTLGQGDLDALFAGNTPAAKTEEPNADDLPDTLGQGDLDALFAGNTPAAKAEEPNVDDLPETLGQSDMDALFAANAPAAKTEEPNVDDLPETLGQSGMDALFAANAPAAKAEEANVDDLPETLGQSDMDALFAEAVAAPEEQPVDESDQTQTLQEAVVSKDEMERLYSGETLPLVSKPTPIPVIERDLTPPELYNPLVTDNEIAASFANKKTTNSVDEPAEQKQTREAETSQDELEELFSAGPATTSQQPEALPSIDRDLTAPELQDIAVSQNEINDTFEETSHTEQKNPIEDLRDATTTQVEMDKLYDGTILPIARKPETIPTVDRDLSAPAMQDPLISEDEISSMYKPKKTTELEQNAAVDEHNQTPEDTENQLRDPITSEDEIHKLYGGTILPIARIPETIPTVDRDLTAPAMQDPLISEDEISSMYKPKIKIELEQNPTVKDNSNTAKKTENHLRDPITSDDEIHELFDRTALPVAKTPETIPSVDRDLTEPEMQEPLIREDDISSMYNPTTATKSEQNPAVEEQSKTAEDTENRPPDAVTSDEDSAPQPKQELTTSQTELESLFESKKTLPEQETASIEPIERDLTTPALKETEVTEDELSQIQENTSTTKTDSNELRTTEDELTEIFDKSASLEDAKTFPIPDTERDLTAPELHEPAVTDEELTQAQDPVILDNKTELEESIVPEHSPALEEAAVVEDTEVLDESVVLEEPAVIEEPVVPEKVEAIEETVVPAMEEEAVVPEEAAVVEEAVALEESALAEEPVVPEEEPAVLENQEAALDEPGEAITFDLTASTEDNPYLNLATDMIDTMFSDNERPEGVRTESSIAQNELDTLYHDNAIIEKKYVRERNLVIDIETDAILTQDELDKMLVQHDEMLGTNLKSAKNDTIKMTDSADKATGQVFGVPVPEAEKINEQEKEFAVRNAGFTLEELQAALGDKRQKSEVLNKAMSKEHFYSQNEINDMSFDDIFSEDYDERKNFNASSKNRAIEPQQVTTAKKHRHDEEINTAKEEFAQRNAGFSLDELAKALNDHRETDILLDKIETKSSNAASVHDIEAILSDQKTEEEINIHQVQEKIEIAPEGIELAEFDSALDKLVNSDEETPTLNTISSNLEPTTEEVPQSELESLLNIGHENSDENALFLPPQAEKSSESATPVKNSKPEKATTGIPTENLDKMFSNDQGDTNDTIHNQTKTSTTINDLESMFSNKMTISKSSDITDEVPEVAEVADSMSQSGSTPGNQTREDIPKEMITKVLQSDVKPDNHQLEKDLDVKSIFLEEQNSEEQVDTNAMSMDATQMFASEEKDAIHTERLTVNDLDNMFSN